MSPPPFVAATWYTLSCMPERLYQSRFDERIRPTVPLDVTPEDFAGLEFHKRERLSRFVREVPKRVYIRSPNDAAQYLLEKIFMPFEDFDQEEMWVLLLDNKLRLTHEVMVYRGTVSTTHIREAELLKEAIRVNAPALILSHCHPSGDPTPSPEDVRVTELVSKAAKLLGLALKDHVVVGEDSWISLKERGLGFA
jgi:DNA repair protein RadC